MFNRNLLLILLTNILLGAPMPLLIILGGFAGAALAPTPELITVPVSAQLLAGILVASPLSLLMGKVGRRSGFLFVCLLTIVGALIAVLSLQLSSFWLLCAAHLVMGAALIGVNFLRFAAAESVPAIHRPNAISFTLASGIVAALIGPTLYAVAGGLFPQLPFAGAYSAIALLGLMGVLPVLALTLPPPKSADDHESASESAGESASLRSAWQLLLERPALRLAVAVAATSQALMILMMVPTPQAMVDHGFMHDEAASVIRWHVVAMFAPGLVAGLMIRRFGVHTIIYWGLAMLMAASLAAVAGTSGMHFHIALILLGVGWNFGFVGGTQLLQSALSEAEKPVMQGVNDTIIALASVSASVVSGLLYSGMGWVASAWALVPVVLFMLVWLFQAQRGRVLHREEATK